MGSEQHVVWCSRCYNLNIAHPATETFLDGYLPCHFCSGTCLRLPDRFGKYAVSAFASLTQHEHARTNAGCNVWVYEVVQTAGIYDTWSTNSERVGYAYQGNEIHSLSVGESWVNVDYLYTTNYGDSPLIKYHNDYFQKAYLDYKTCFSR
jgi:hypothetical protein